MMLLFAKIILLIVFLSASISYFNSVKFSILSVLFYFLFIFLFTKFVSFVYGKIDGE